MDWVDFVITIGFIALAMFATNAIIFKGEPLR
jgi:hypothetical protein